jgi:hypothetical protein
MMLRPVEAFQHTRAVIPPYLCLLTEEPGRIADVDTAFGARSKPTADGSFMFRVNAAEPGLRLV